jgi:uncharacterized repeat protein (TIGR03803 family)
MRLHLFLASAILAAIAAPAVASTFAVLHIFSHVSEPLNGDGPFSGVFFDRKSGDLFGTTNWDGDEAACGGSGCGTVFALTPDGNRHLTTFQLVHTFEFGVNGSADGAHTGGVILDRSGNLYGPAYEGGDSACNPPLGCGVAYMLVAPLVGKREPNERILHTFEGSEGSFPLGPLTLDQGRLLGTANQGGTSGAGVVFSLAPDAHRTKWTFTSLYDFGKSPDGARPATSLMTDANGDLFGTTVNGGNHNFGTVFELTSNGTSWSETVLQRFGTDTTGYYATSGLVADTSGNLFGVTVGHFRHKDVNDGNVFELASGGNQWSETVLHNFDDSDGRGPMEDRLVRDAKGNLFGTTEYGGTGNAGTIFELVYNSGLYTFKKLYDFCTQSGCPDGAYPSGLVIDAAGNLYGTAGSGGGSTSDGTVFMFTP